MSKEYLRVAKSPDEICQILKDVIEQKAEVVLWQKIQNERRTMLAEFRDLNLSEGTLLLKSLNNAVFSLENEISLQVRGQSFSIFFHSKIDFTTDDQIILEIPSSLELLDHPLVDPKPHKLT